MLNIKKMLTKLANRIQVGATSVGTVAANSYTDISITFDKPFGAVPSVMVCLNSNSTSPKMGLMTVATLSRSTTGFEARIFNADSSSRSPWINWMAIGN